MSSDMPPETGHGPLNVHRPA